VADINLLTDKNIHGAVVRVEDAEGAPLLVAAAGEARPGIAMTAAHGFHIASVTKTMTAAVVLQLAEEGALGPRGIDAAYGDFGVFAPEIMARLHRSGGESLAHRITLRHLLTHTSGLRDAMEDDAATLGGPAPDSLIGRILAPGGDRRRAWKPWDPERPLDPEAGVINLFLANGTADAPLAAPGEGFHYSDTGFMLLALLIEKLTGCTLGDAYRERLFAPLGLADTYLAYRNDPPGLGPHREPEAEVWMGPMPVLGSGASLSFDWGGGGVVSSAASLNRFLRGLLGGALFRDHRTLAAMLDWQTPPGLAAPRTGVGLGIFRTEDAGLELIGHSGASGAKMFHAPRHGFFIAGTINQMAGPGTWHWPIAHHVAAASSTGGQA
jgi:D-alanyl-D-alanine carboxypeptidase